MNQAPKTLHIVLNGVTEDSRVLKCAWSLGNAGWDVTVIGATATAQSDSLSIGYAQILRLPLKIVIAKGSKQSFLLLLIRGERSEWLIKGILRRLRRYRRKLFEKSKVKSEVVVPNLNRSVKIITPIAIKLQPNIVHAHDYTALPIAGAVVDALRAKGKAVQLVYDAHEYVPGVAHLTVPMGAVFGLPVGLSIVAGKWEDAKVLSFGYAFEQKLELVQAPAYDASLRVVPAVSDLFGRFNR